jgi:1-acyl-sn-glycerol-3-phosphate acyltransferase
MRLKAGAKTKIIDNVSFFIFLYPLGLFGGIIFWLLVRLGKIEIKNRERISQIDSGSLLVSNHPSLLEPLIIAFLLFPLYRRHPFAYRPWSTPDSKNFYNRWWFRPFRKVSIPINRGDEGTHRERLALLRMLQIIKKGKGIIIAFLEGTRTFKSIEAGRVIYSKRGKALGFIKREIGILAAFTTFQITPVWVNGVEKIFPNTAETEKAFGRKDWYLLLHLLYHYLVAFMGILSSKNKIIINVGEPFIVPRGTSGQETSQRITQALLELADQ